MRVLFFFKGNRKALVEKHNKVPNDFFYGYKELKNRLNEVDFVEESSFSSLMKKNTILTRLSDFLADKIGINVLKLFSFIKSGDVNQVMGYDVVIATTASSAMLFSLLKKLHYIKKECSLYCYVMGLFDDRINFFKKYLFRWVFSESILLSLSRCEQDQINKIYKNKINAKFIGFGVDTEFWKFTPENSTLEPYVLSIGNDSKRDYKLLVDAWNDTLPKLTIITKQNIDVNNKRNISHNVGDWHKQIYTDIQIRELYNNALFVIVPVKQTYQPSGQSVCLQAMACGKAVIMANINGIWEPEHMVHGENCLLYEPGNITDLRKCIKKLLDDDMLRVRISSNAKETVRQYMNINIMADRLAENIGV